LPPAGAATPFEDQSIFFILMIAPGWRQASGARSVPSGQRHDEISYPQPVITTRVQFKMVQGDLAGASPATTLASPTPAEWRPLRAPGWGKPSLPRKKMNRTVRGVQFIASVWEHGALQEAKLHQR